MDRAKLKVMVVFGTRPEAIKMCPLINELKKNDSIDCRVCLTGQHREMLKQVMLAFRIDEDFNLDIMREQQNLTAITVSILNKMEELLKREKPDLVLVHGDTTTSFVTSLAAFYEQIPIGHVEAGLRTGNIYSPYPEEMNRLLIGRLASLHFAPTEQNYINLKNENVIQNIYITGNTVIDALKTTVKEEYIFQNGELNKVDYANTKTILLTAHRRENIGKALENICCAIKRIVKEYKDVLVIYPVHLNPVVRKTVFAVLGGCDRVKLLEPLDVFDMHNLMARSYLVMTDSGGLQEEAPFLGKPVLVLRTETERPEAVEAGTVRVVGTEEDNVFAETKNLLEHTEAYKKMAKAVNPYGDGNASKRIVESICKFYNLVD